MAATAVYGEQNKVDNSFAGKGNQCENKNNMKISKSGCTSVVDGEAKDEHVTSGQADDGVGDTRRDRQLCFLAIISRISPHSLFGAYELYRH